MADERSAGGKMTVRQWMALMGITFSAFVLNTSEFMPMGLLTDISSSFGISEATGGIMITAYAWAVTILSLPLMMAASRIELKRLLIGVLAVFAAGQVLSAISPPTRCSPRRVSWWRARTRSSGPSLRSWRPVWWTCAMRRSP